MTFKRMRPLAFTFTLAAAALTASFASHAQTVFPSKPVRINVGASAGGGTDIIARLFAEKMEGCLVSPSLWTTGRALPIPSPPI